jgi:Glyoxalase/Bleomycin resistance protein/Dioxygenase superfamily
MPTCSCCGEERDHVARLLCHDDVAVCKDCVGWLRASLPDAVDATPILKVRGLDEAEAFWAAVGQELERWQGGGYGFVGEYGEILHVGEEPEGGAGGGACYLRVADVEAWHRGWAEGGYEPGAVEVMPWGMREFVVDDPSGNTIRVGQPA